MPENDPMSANVSDQELAAQRLCYRVLQMNPSADEAFLKSALESINDDTSPYYDPISGNLKDDNLFVDQVNKQFSAIQATLTSGEYNDLEGQRNYLKNQEKTINKERNTSLARKMVEAMYDHWKEKNPKEKNTEKFTEKVLSFAEKRGPRKVNKNFYYAPKLAELSLPSAGAELDSPDGAAQENPLQQIIKEVIKSTSDMINDQPVRNDDISERSESNDSANSDLSTDSATPAQQSLGDLNGQAEILLLSQKPLHEFDDFKNGQPATPSAGMQLYNFFGNLFADPGGTLANAATQAVSVGQQAVTRVVDAAPGLTATALDSIKNTATFVGQAVYTAPTEQTEQTADGKPYSLGEQISAMDNPDDQMIANLILEAALENAHQNTLFGGTPQTLTQKNLKAVTVDSVRDKLSDRIRSRYPDLTEEGQKEQIDGIISVAYSDLASTVSTVKTTLSDGYPQDGVAAFGLVPVGGIPLKTVQDVIHRTNTSILTVSPNQGISDKEENINQGIFREGYQAEGKLAKAVVDAGIASNKQSLLAQAQQAQQAYVNHYVQFAHQDDYNVKLAELKTEALNRSAALISDEPYALKENGLFSLSYDNTALDIPPAARKTLDHLRDQAKNQQLLRNNRSKRPAPEPKTLLDSLVGKILVHGQPNLTNPDLQPNLTDLDSKEAQDLEKAFDEHKQSWHSLIKNELASIKEQQEQLGKSIGDDVREQLNSRQETLILLEAATKKHYLSRPKEQKKLLNLLKQEYLESKPGSDYLLSSDDETKNANATRALRHNATDTPDLTALPTFFQPVCQITSDSLSNTVSRDLHDLDLTILEKKNQAVQAQQDYLKSFLDKNPDPLQPLAQARLEYDNLRRLVLACGYDESVFQTSTRDELLSNDEMTNLKESFENFMKLPANDRANKDNLIPILTALPPSLWSVVEQSLQKETDTPQDKEQKDIVFTAAKKTAQKERLSEAIRKDLSLSLKLSERYWGIRKAVLTAMQKAEEQNQEFFAFLSKNPPITLDAYEQNPDQVITLVCAEIEKSTIVSDASAQDGGPALYRDLLALEVARCYQDLRGDPPNPQTLVPSSLEEANTQLKSYQEQKAIEQGQKTIQSLTESMDQAISTLPPQLANPLKTKFEDSYYENGELKIPTVLEGIVSLQEILQTKEQQLLTLVTTIKESLSLSAAAKEHVLNYDQDNHIPGKSKALNQDAISSVMDSLDFRSDQRNKKKSDSSFSLTTLNSDLQAKYRILTKALLNQVTAEHTFMDARDVLIDQGEPAAVFSQACEAVKPTPQNILFTLLILQMAKGRATLDRDFFSMGEPRVRFADLAAVTFDGETQDLNTIYSFLREKVVSDSPAPSSDGKSPSSLQSTYGPDLSTAMETLFNLKQAFPQNESGLDVKDIEGIQSELLKNLKNLKAPSLPTDSPSLSFYGEKICQYGYKPSNFNNNNRFSDSFNAHAFTEIWGNPPTVQRDFQQERSYKAQEKFKNALQDAITDDPSKALVAIILSLTKNRAQLDTLNQVAELRYGRINPASLDPLNPESDTSIADMCKKVGIDCSSEDIKKVYDLVKKHFPADSLLNLGEEKVATTDTITELSAYYIGDIDPVVLDAKLDQKPDPANIALVSKLRQATGVNLLSKEQRTFENFNKCMDTLLPEPPKASLGVNDDPSPESVVATGVIISLLKQQAQANSTQVAGIGFGATYIGKNNLMDLISKQEGIVNCLVQSYCLDKQAATDNVNKILGVLYDNFPEENFDAVGPFAIFTGLRATYPPVVYDRITGYKFSETSEPLKTFTTKLQQGTLADDFNTFLNPENYQKHVAERLNELRDSVFDSQTDYLQVHFSATKNPDDKRAQALDQLAKAEQYYEDNASYIPGQPTFETFCQEQGILTASQMGAIADPTSVKELVEPLDPTQSVVAKIQQLSQDCQNLPEYAQGKSKNQGVNVNIARRQLLAGVETSPYKDLLLGGLTEAHSIKSQQDSELQPLIDSYYTDLITNGVPATPSDTDPALDEIIATAEKIGRDIKKNYDSKEAFLTSLGLRVREPSDNDFIRVLASAATSPPNPTAADQLVKQIVSSDFDSLPSQLQKAAKNMINEKVKENLSQRDISTIDRRFAEADLAGFCASLPGNYRAVAMVLLKMVEDKAKTKNRFNPLNQLYGGLPAYTGKDNIHDLEQDFDSCYDNLTSFFAGLSLLPGNEDTKLPQKESVRVLLQHLSEHYPEDTVLQELPAELKEQTGLGDIYTNVVDTAVLTRVRNAAEQLSTEKNASLLKLVNNCDFSAAVDTRSALAASAFQGLINQSVSIGKSDVTPFLEPNSGLEDYLFATLEAVRLAKKIDTAQGKSPPMYKSWQDLRECLGLSQFDALPLPLQNLINTAVYEKGMDMDTNSEILFNRAVHYRAQASENLQNYCKSLDPDGQSIAYTIFQIMGEKTQNEKNFIQRLLPGGTSQVSEASLLSINTTDILQKLGAPIDDSSLAEADEVLANIISRYPRDQIFRVAMGPFSVSTDRITDGAFTLNELEKFSETLNQQLVTGNADESKYRAQRSGELAVDPGKMFVGNIASLIESNTPSQGETTLTEAQQYLAVAIMMQSLKAYAEENYVEKLTDQDLKKALNYDDRMDRITAALDAVNIPLPEGYLGILNQLQTGLLSNIVGHYDGSVSVGDLDVALGAVLDTDAVDTSRDTIVGLFDQDKIQTLAETCRGDQQAFFDAIKESNNAEMPTLYQKAQASTAALEKAALIATGAHANDERSSAYRAGWLTSEGLSHFTQNADGEQYLKEVMEAVSAYETNVEAVSAYQTNLDSKKVKKAHSASFAKLQACLADPQFYRLPQSVGNSFMQALPGREIRKVVEQTRQFNYQQAKKKPISDLCEKISKSDRIIALAILKLTELNAKKNAAFFQQATFVGQNNLSALSVDLVRSVLPTADGKPISDEDIENTLQQFKQAFPGDEKTQFLGFMPTDDNIMQLTDLVTLQKPLAGPLSYDDAQAIQNLSVDDLLEKQKSVVAARVGALSPEDLALARKYFDIWRANFPSSQSNVSAPVVSPDTTQKAEDEKDAAKAILSQLSVGTNAIGVDAALERQETAATVTSSVASTESSLGYSQSAPANLVTSTASSPRTSSVSSGTSLSAQSIPRFSSVTPTVSSSATSRDSPSTHSTMTTPTSSSSSGTKSNGPEYNGPHPSYSQAVAVNSTPSQATTNGSLIDLKAATLTNNLLAAAIQQSTNSSFDTVKATIGEKSIHVDEELQSAVGKITPLINAGHITPVYEDKVVQGVKLDTQAKYKGCSNFLSSIEAGKTLAAMMHPHLANNQTVTFIVRGSLDETQAKINGIQQYARENKLDLANCKLQINDGAKQEFTQSYATCIQKMARTLGPGLNSRGPKKFPN